ncbi:MAG TPA: lysophospholipid acyltransferase family protein [Candidatus Hydrogenedens sp.]|nr:lysophospholipid acyltransferase family protein [Candidatus Hydrogenedens sp.]
MRLPDIPYDSPYTFSRKQKIALTILPPVISFFLKNLFALCEWTVFDKEEYVDRTMETEGRVLIAFWHEHMAFGAHLFQGTHYHTLTSYSYDGELAARIVHRFGLEAVRGSSSKGGSDALKGLQKALENQGCVGWTLDGPKGPRRVAKPGIAVLSARTKTPIVPMTAIVSKCWRLNSWDCFPVPKPFSKIYVSFGPIIPPPSSEEEHQIENTRREVENALNTLIQRLQKVTGIQESI